MSYVAELRRLVGTRPLILPGTSVLILDERGRILLVERTDMTGWGLPGGFIEPGESFEEAGRREVAEEVGIELGELRLLQVFSGPELYFRYDHGDEVFNVTAAYVATTSARPRVNEAEIRTARFFPAGEIPRDFVAPERPIVDYYLGSSTHGDSVTT